MGIDSILDELSKDFDDYSYDVSKEVENKIIKKIDRDDLLIKNLTKEILVGETGEFSIHDILPFTLIDKINSCRIKIVIKNKIVSVVDVKRSDTILKLESIDLKQKFDILLEVEKKELIDKEEKILSRDIYKLYLAKLNSKSFLSKLYELIIISRIQNCYPTIKSIKKATSKNSNYYNKLINKYYFINKASYTKTELIKKIKRTYIKKNKINKKINSILELSEPLEVFFDNKRFNCYKKFMIANDISYKNFKSIRYFNKSLYRWFELKEKISFIDFLDN